MVIAVVLSVSGVGFTLRVVKGGMDHVSRAEKWLFHVSRKINSAFHVSRK